MSNNKNFIDRKLDELHAYYFAIGIRCIPENRKKIFFGGISDQTIANIAKLTFDKSDQELKDLVNKCHHELEEKCEDAELEEIKKILKR